MSEREHLEQAIAALEAQRAVLGDAVVAASVAALRRQLASLEPPPAVAPQRKMVTLLFADLSGFTALSETMDAEDVSDLMNALWRRLDTVIRDYGGHIDKHMGDAVMALWGAELAQEDDPERAIRAALSMQAEVRSFAIASAAPLQMRIAIHTGQVLLGAVGTTGEFTAIGDAVNTTSRLQYAAPVGGILISQDTYRHVHGLFVVQPLAPLTIRGKSEPVLVYVVLQAMPRTFRLGTRGVEGVETRMVGREAELAQLQAAFQQVAAEQAGRLITISGEAGVGKSRLLFEFSRWLDNLPRAIYYFKGRASPEMQALPYALLRDCLVFRFEIQDSDPADVVRDKIEQGLGAMLGERGREKAHILGQLAGFDFSASPYLQGVLGDAQQLRDRGLLYLGDYFWAVASALPTVILLEDVHWADDSTLDALEYLARATAAGMERAGSILIIVAARPALFERRPAWGQGHLHLLLQPLSHADTHLLLDEILQKVDEVPERLGELIVDGAEGNPFYVEELVKMLIEDGIIVKGAERWRVEAERLTSVRVPPTLTGVLQARLDSLPDEERAVLQQAAVVGRIFWDGAVAHIAHAAAHAAAPAAAPAAEGVPPADLGRTPDVVPEALSALQSKEMVFHRATSAFAGTQEYIFKHAILREVTYESVLKRLRRIYHGLVADWLIAHSGGRAGEFTGLIAEHLARAGRTDEALFYLRRAGEEAAARFANAEALACFTRALELTPAEDREGRFALLRARERVYDLRGEREPQWADLAALDEVTAALGDPLRQAEVALRRAVRAEATSDYEAGIAAAQAAIRFVAPRAGEAAAVALKAEAHLRWGQALRRQGEYAAARMQLEQALVRAQEGQVLPVIADSLCSLGTIAVFQGDYVWAQGYLEQALAFYRQVGSRRGESVVLNLLGVNSFYQDKYAGAQGYYEQSLLISREMGDRLSEGRALANLGMIAFRHDDYVTAKSYTEQALAILRGVGNRQNEATGLKWCGHLAYSVADFAAAADFYAQSLHICREIGDRWGAGEALGGLGEVARARGDYAGALDHYEQSLLISREMRNREGECWVLNGLGDVYRLWGNYERARPSYEEALTTAGRIGNRWHRNRALCQLSLLAHAQGDDVAALAHSQEVLANAQELGSRSLRAGALLGVGHALLGQGDLAGAGAAYGEALALRCELGLHPLAVEPRAGLARVALAQGDPLQARSHVEEILARLEAGPLQGLEDPASVYLVCCQTLRATQDPRAREVQDRVYHLLVEQAAALDEDSRRTFWEGVAAHHEILDFGF